MRAFKKRADHRTAVEIEFGYDQAKAISQAGERINDAHTILTRSRIMRAIDGEFPLNRLHPDAGAWAKCIRDLLQDDETHIRRLLLRHFGLNDARVAEILHSRNDYVRRFLPSIRTEKWAGMLPLGLRSRAAELRQTPYRWRVVVGKKAMVVASRSEAEALQNGLRCLYSTDGGVSAFREAVKGRVALARQKMHEARISERALKKALLTGNVRICGPEDQQRGADSPPDPFHLCAMIHATSHFNVVILRYAIRLDRVSIPPASAERHCLERITASPCLVGRLSGKYLPKPWAYEINKLDLAAVAFAWHDYLLIQNVTKLLHPRVVRRAKPECRPPSAWMQP